MADQTQYKPWRSCREGLYYWHDAARFSAETPDELPTEVFRRLKNYRPDYHVSSQSAPYSTREEAMADLKQALNPPVPLYKPWNYGSSGLYRWWRVGGRVPPMGDLPSEVFDRLRDGRLDANGIPDRSYATETEAYADLTRALIVGDTVKTAVVFYDPVTGAQQKVRILEDSDDGREQARRTALAALQDRLTYWADLKVV